MKVNSLSILPFLLLVGTCSSCKKTKSLYLKNNSNTAIEIIYDDRVYRSHFGPKRTLKKHILHRDEVFFIAPDSCISEIFPDYLQINLAKDTIILIGKRAIKAMINEDGPYNYLINIH